MGLLKILLNRVHKKKVCLRVLWMLLPVLPFRFALSGNADQNPPNLLLEAQENLSLDDDPTQPPVTFMVKEGNPDFPVSFSGAQAGEDDLKDALRNTRAWQLQIFDSHRRKVSFVQGTGEPPPLKINWDGMSSKGKLVPNGFYTARLVWLDEAKKAFKTPPVTVNLLALPEIRNFLGPQVALSYVDEGLIIRIAEGLVFASGRWELQEESLSVLEKITVFLKDHPQNRLIVQGYTDASGSSKINDRISISRAKAVYQYLIGKGIDTLRITYEGFGASHPIASNATADGRAKNRRVEIVVLKSET